MFLLKFLVKDVDTHTFSNAGQLGDVLGNLVDGFSLLFQKLVFEELGQMRVVVGTGKCMDFQQSLNNKLNVNKQEMT